jgi:hypothetical protein
MYCCHNGGVGKAFGFSVPPRVDLNLSARGDKSTVRNKKRPRSQDGDDGFIELIILLFTVCIPYWIEWIRKQAEEGSIYVIRTRF